jgi:hypothetical protein
VISLLYDPSAYDNLTINEIDAQFASLIHAKLKEQSALAFQPRRIARSDTVDETDDNMPALLLPPEYPLCNDSIDNNTSSDAKLPPEGDHIASRVGGRRQGNSLLSYAHHVASLDLPTQVTQRDEFAVNLAEYIDPIAGSDPSCPNRLDSTKF